MSLDPRLNAFRPDLADARLAGQAGSARLVEGRPARIAAPVADLRNDPTLSAGLGSQLLRGDEVLVFEEHGGWGWVQSERDSYVGYLQADALARRGAPATHIVAAPRTFIYTADDMKSPRADALSIGTLLTIAGTSERRGTAYAELAEGGFVIAAHLRPVSDEAADFVAVAETLEFTPYLWGGASAFGLDCSGLVQLSMRMAGRPVLRDTDMQARSVGTEIDPGRDCRDLRRGDLVFWNGHVAIMTDAENLIHANGHTMTVSRERLDDAVRRISYLYGAPTGFRRS